MSPSDEIVGIIPLGAIGDVLAHHPDHLVLLDPGTHTVELDVADLLERNVSRAFNDATLLPKAETDDLMVGFQQLEFDGSPQVTASWQVAVQFNTSLLDQIPNKQVDRAVLVYDETMATGCYPDLGGDACWTSGSLIPEDKPNGCVVVRIPSTDWMAVAPNGEFPFITDPRPTVNRLAVREWDVTEPFLWQKVPGAMPLSPPNGPAFSAGFGFLLSGGLTIDQLEAEDSTNCLSVISNIRLRTTYTVFEDEPFHDPH
jgi:hypothetical protein